MIMFLINSFFGPIRGELFLPHTVHPMEEELLAALCALATTASAAQRYLASGRQPGRCSETNENCI